MTSFIVAAALCIAATAGVAKGAAGSGVSKLAKRMADEKWEERKTAFYDLVRMAKGGSESESRDDVRLHVSSLINDRAEDAPTIKLALIEVLTLENDRVRREAELSDEFTEYYGDLISAVASLKDPRAADSLAGALGSGTMVIRSLAELGWPAVKPVVERLEVDGDRRVNFSACRVLRTLLRPTSPHPISDPKKIQQIQAALNREPCKN